SGALPDPNNLAFDTTFANPVITGIVQIGDTLWLATRTGGVGFARLSTGLTDWRKANQGLTNLAVEDLAWNGRFLVTSGPTVHGYDFGTHSWSLIGSFGTPLSATG